MQLSIVFSTFCTSYCQNDYMKGCSMKLCEHCIIHFHSNFCFLDTYKMYDVFVFLRGDILHDYLKLYKYIFNLHINKALQ